MTWMNFLVYFVLAAMTFPWTKPKVLRPLTKMEAVDGNEGREFTHIFYTDLTHINIETTPTVDNVPAELGSSIQEETGVGQQGKDLHLLLIPTLTYHDAFSNT